MIPAEARSDAIRSERERSPGATWLAILISGLLRALHDVGVPVAQDISVVMDLRRYLSSQSLDGNFVIGVPLNIDHRCGPEAVTAMMKATIVSGRPVATQMLATLTSIRSRGCEATSVDPTQPVRVTFSGMGRPPQIDSLPFIPGRPPVYAGGVEPDGPHGLTFLISETSGASVVSASFHENVVPTHTVHAALTTTLHRLGGQSSEQAVNSWSG
jgi:hypothetical protein